MPGILYDAIVIHHFTGCTHVNYQTHCTIVYHASHGAHIVQASMHVVELRFSCDMCRSLYMKYHALKQCGHFERFRPKSVPGMLRELCHKQSASSVSNNRQEIAQSEMQACATQLERCMQLAEMDRTAGQDMTMMEDPNHSSTEHMIHPAGML
jgi:hypothetical protein